MKKLQKTLIMVLGLGMTGMVYYLPVPEIFSRNIYRILPFYGFLKEEVQKTAITGDRETTEKIIQANGRYLKEKVQEENSKEVMKKEDEHMIAEAEETNVAIYRPRPKINMSLEKLMDAAYVMDQFFIVDAKAFVSDGLIDAEYFLNMDLSVKANKSDFEILIYHSHSQESFCDSRPGKAEDTIVGVGSYLAELLSKKYGYKVTHITEKFDLVNGVIDRSKAYEYARSYLKDYLEKNKNIKVIIDLHRDGVSEDRHLVTEINGKPTAQIMFYNGLSHTVDYGQVEYLPNPYIKENLAFSFQMEYQAALYYPELYRGIYLAGLRYNLDFLPRCVLLEAGAQTNAVQEVKNAMEPFADILDRVLKDDDN